MTGGSGRSTLGVDGGGGVTTALAVALGAEVLLLGCAAAAWILHRSRRRRRLEEHFAAASADARKVALDARIIDASFAELSELVLERSLRELGLDDPPLASPPSWPDESARP